MSDDEYERMKRAIKACKLEGLSPLRAVAQMRPPLQEAGTLLRRWLDECHEYDLAP